MWGTGDILKHEFAEKYDELITKHKNPFKVLFKVRSNPDNENHWHINNS